MRPSEISDLVWRIKYQLSRSDGSVESSIEETWDRVATALSSPETDSSAWHQRYMEAFCASELIPGGRIIAGAGTDREVTLYNTFVMGLVPDDFLGVMTTLNESAETMRQGGGIGCNFSGIRPNGSGIRGTGGTCPGPLAFLQLWNSMCEVILKGGTRRGAMIAMLPLLAGLAWMLGLMALSSWHINFMNIVVFPLVFGYGISAGVHLYHRYIESNSVMVAVKHTGRSSKCGNFRNQR